MLFSTEVRMGNHKLYCKHLRSGHEGKLHKHCDASVCRRTSIRSIMHPLISGVSTKGWDVWGRTFLTSPSAHRLSLHVLTDTRPRPYPSPGLRALEARINVFVLFPARTLIEWFCMPVNTAPPGVPEL